MYKTREYYVKYKEDTGLPYAFQATSKEEATRKLVKMSPCTNDAIILVYTSIDAEPYEFNAYELK